MHIARRRHSWLVALVATATIVVSFSGTPARPAIAGPQSQDSAAGQHDGLLAPISVLPSDVAGAASSLTTAVPVQPLVSDGSDEAGPTIGTSFIGRFDLSNEEPPDTQLAVGPKDIVEIVNDRFAFYSRSGILLDVGPLRSFFQVPDVNANSADPRVLYDIPSGRFFATYISYHNAPGGPGVIHVAVSTTNSALSEWKVYAVSLPYLIDAPTLGVSDDRVVVSGTVFGLPSMFAQAVIGAVGEQTFVFEKANLHRGARGAAGGNAHHVRAAPSNPLSFAITRGRAAPVRVASTATGIYCFQYSGPTTTAANFGSLFTTAVTAVNKLNFPDGSYSSWFPAAPDLATISSIADGAVLCVAAPIGTLVFVS